MSVPPDRMAVRQTGDPNKILGVKKPVFWVIIAAGLVLAIYLWRRSKNTNASSPVNTDPEAGLTSADIGGTPSDNSFATQTDQTALENQIQQMQDAINALEGNNGGNGGGVGGSPGGNPGGSGGDSTGSSGSQTGGIGADTLPIIFPHTLDSQVESAIFQANAGVSAPTTSFTEPIISQMGAGAGPGTSRGMI